MLSIEELVSLYGDLQKNGYAPDEEELFFELKAAINTYILFQRLSNKIGSRLNLKVDIDVIQQKK